MNKPGYRTTEFWLTVAMHFLTLLIASGVFAPESAGAKITALILSALTQLSYNFSRAAVKATGAALAAPPDDAEA